MNECPSCGATGDEPCQQDCPEHEYDCGLLDWFDESTLDWQWDPPQ